MSGWTNTNHCVECLRRVDCAGWSAEGDHPNQSVAVIRGFSATVGLWPMTAVSRVGLDAVQLARLVLSPDFGEPIRGARPSAWSRPPERRQRTDPAVSGPAANGASQA